MSLFLKSFYILSLNSETLYSYLKIIHSMATSKKSSITKKPKVVGVEVLKKNGVECRHAISETANN